MPKAYVEPPPLTAPKCLIRPPAPPPPEQPPLPAAREATCDDRQDDDGDSLADCADSDCFDAPNCQAGQSDERDDQRCSDWIDNDGDGSVDCEDEDCSLQAVTFCYPANAR